MRCDGDSEAADDIGPVIITFFLSLDLFRAPYCLYPLSISDDTEN